MAPLKEWLGEWGRAVGEHHERWDGEGYPTGLSGTDISYAARIVAVADVFDVITSARSYKDPIPATAAREEIARCSGTHFDPDVVRAFLNLSIGRLRLAMGPLSLLAQSPLGGVSIPPMIGTALTGLAVGAASVIGGVFTAPAATAASAAPTPKSAAAAPAQRPAKDPARPAAAPPAAPADPASDPAPDPPTEPTTQVTCTQVATLGVFCASTP